MELPAATAAPVDQAGLWTRFTACIDGSEHESRKSSAFESICRRVVGRYTGQVDEPASRLRRLLLSGGRRQSLSALQDK